MLYKTQLLQHFVEKESVEFLWIKNIFIILEKNVINESKESVEK